ncbi:hypothetical protein ASG70_11960 [Phycicoccus sp. Soil748]|nr:hypothetical protein ASG70_11960 [Phycicoccus sp. Soil748]
MLATQVSAVWLRFVLRSATMVVAEAGAFEVGESMRRARSDRGAWVIAAAWILASCSGAQGEGARHASSVAPPTTPTSCDGGAISDAPKLLLTNAEQFRGKGLTACDVDRATDGSLTFTTTSGRPDSLGRHDLAPLIAFDGGPLPADCHISTTSRLFVLIDEQWWEGRQVGCDG